MKDKQFLEIEVPEPGKGFALPQIILPRFTDQVFLKPSVKDSNSKVFSSRSISCEAAREIVAMIKDECESLKEGFENSFMMEFKELADSQDVKLDNEKVCREIAAPFQVLDYLWEVFEPREEVAIVPFLEQVQSSLLTDSICCSGDALECMLQLATVSASPSRLATVITHFQQPLAERQRRKSTVAQGRRMSLPDRLQRVTSQTDAIKLKIIKGKNLMIADKSGFSDPYCVGIITDTAGTSLMKFKTEIKKATLNPVWNCERIIDTQMAGQIEKIMFQVMDHDYLRVDDHLGQAVLSIAQVRVELAKAAADGRNSTRMKLNLVRSAVMSANPTGRITVEFEVLDANQAYVPWSSGGAREFSATPVGPAVPAQQEEEEAEPEVAVAQPGVEQAQL